MTRLKKLTIYVEAYAEMSRDAGSIPAASTNKIKQTDMNRKADSRNNNSLLAFFVLKVQQRNKFLNCNRSYDLIRENTTAYQYQPSFY